jgi:HrpA-like RNA helicase
MLVVRPGGTAAAAEGVVRHPLSLGFTLVDQPHIWHKHHDVHHHDLADGVMHPSPFHPYCLITHSQALGIDNIMRFDWLAPPPAEAAVRGLELLHALGALDGDAK